MAKIEFPKSDNQEEHRKWMPKASIEQLDEYLIYHSSNPTFCRMANAQRNKLILELKNKTETLKNKELKYPEKVTLYWLFKNVPARLWITDLPPV